MVIFNRTKRERYFRPLTPDEAALVKGMIRRGDRLQDIAQYFGVNPARPAEIGKGTKFAEILEAEMDALPAPGPYPCGEVLVALMEAISVQGESAVLSSLRDMGQKRRRRNAAPQPMDTILGGLFGQIEV